MPQRWASEALSWLSTREVGKNKLTKNISKAVEQSESKNLDTTFGVKEPELDTRNYQEKILF